jgi:multidrug efflux system outer membrane protein
MQDRQGPRRAVWARIGRVRVYGGAALALVLGACVVAPVARNDSPVALPDRYLRDRHDRLVPVPQPDAALATWWRGFQDPVLDQLVAQGLAGSVSIDEAEARLREAEALARRAGNLTAGNGSVTAETGEGTDTASTGLSLSLDPFGSRRRGAEAALARLQAARYGVQDARLQLLSALTQTYVELRFLQASLSEQRADLASRNRTLADIGRLLDRGAATQLDRIRAEALVAETQTRIPELEARIAQAGYRLATLLGQPAGALGIDLRGGRQPVPTETRAIGIPADLVRRRPDIAQAERLYAAALSEVSAAKAARYPSLSLSGTIVSPIAAGTSGSASALTAGLVLPIFSQPGLAAEVDASRARADLAYLQWRSVVLSAVEEVETALAAITGSRQAVASARRVVALNTEALDLSRRLLDGSGEITVLDLLDRERAVAEARATLSQTRRDYALNVIDLYVALGLGVEGAVAQ